MYFARSQTGFDTDLQHEKKYFTILLFAFPSDNPTDCIGQ
jgi:hypothetical protein